MKDERARKVYVQVKVDFSPEGQMRPRELIWEDGTRHEIDRILDVKQAAELKCGGQGDRYTIMVRGKERHLFFERNGSVTGRNIGRWSVPCSRSAS